MVALITSKALPCTILNGVATKICQLVPSWDLYNMKNDFVENIMRWICQSWAPHVENFSAFFNSM